MADRGRGAGVRGCRWSRCSGGWRSPRARSPGCWRSSGCSCLHSDDRPIFDGLTSGLGLVCLLGSVAAGVATPLLLLRGRSSTRATRRRFAVGAVVTGWAVAQSPDLLPGVSVDEAAASDATIVALLISDGGRGAGADPVADAAVRAGAGRAVRRGRVGGRAAAAATGGRFGPPAWVLRAAIGCAVVGLPLMLAFDSGRRARGGGGAGAGGGGARVRGDGAVGGGGGRVGRACRARSASAGDAVNPCGSSALPWSPRSGCDCVPQMRYWATRGSSTLLCTRGAPRLMVGGGPGRGGRELTHRQRDSAEECAECDRCISGGATLQRSSTCRPSLARKGARPPSPRTGAGATAHGQRQQLPCPLPKPAVG